MAGSMKKVMDETAIDLSKTKWPSGLDMFNVTVLCEKDNAKLLSNYIGEFKKLLNNIGSSLHLIELDYYKPETINTPTGIDPISLINHENLMFSQLLYKKDEDTAQLIENSNFDGAVSAMIPFEVIILKAYNLPVLKWGSYLPDPVMIVFNLNPWDLSSNLPLIHPFPNMMHSLGHFHLLNRAWINNIAMALDLMFNHVAYSSRKFTTPIAKQAYSRLWEDVIVGDGFNGIRD